MPAIENSREAQITFPSFLMENYRWWKIPLSFTFFFFFDWFFSTVEETKNFKGSKRDLWSADGEIQWVIDVIKKASNDSSQNTTRWIKLRRKILSECWKLFHDSVFYFCSSIFRSREIEKLSNL